VVVYLATLYYKFSAECAGEKIENRSIFGDGIDKNLRLTFLAYTRVCHQDVLFQALLWLPLGLAVMLVAFRDDNTFGVAE